MDEIISAGIKATGFPNRGHQFVIDQLQEGDVLVVDAWGTIPGFVGDNLATYIEVATRYGGLVIDGGIRDLEGMSEANTQIYYRFAHPAAVTNFTLVGVNVPVSIGKTTVMPGDVVVGDKEGITVLPPQLLEETLQAKTEIVIHDIWTKEKLRTGKYKSHEIYGRPRDPELIKEYEEYRARKYRELGLEPPKH
jgi:regulator of RNase E activity RraA